MPVREIQGTSTRLVLYPNPNQGGEFMLRLPTGAERGTWTIDIHDLTGKVLHSTRTTLVEGADTVVLRSMSLGTGMYVVSATNGSVVLTERMVVHP